MMMGEFTMFGKMILQRMNDLGITIPMLVEQTGISEDNINSFISGKRLLLPDDFDTLVISKALLCDPMFWFDDSIRKLDVITLSCNRGEDTKKSNLAKANIQKFVEDYLFVESLQH